MAASLDVNVQELFSVLSSKNPHRGSQAAQLASDLYQLCIESVSDTELAYCTSVLFSKECGVLKFLREAATLEEFASCKEELLRLLDGYIRNLGDKVLPYAVEIKDVCVALFFRDKSSKVKNATLPPLIAVLELCVRSPIVESLNVSKIAEKFFQACHQPTKHSSTVRGGIFQVLGTLSEVYPECMVAMSGRLVDIFMKTLKTEMVTKQQQKKRPDMPVIGGCLRGLSAYLTQFSQSVAEGSPFAQDIYKFTRMSIDTSVSMTRYEVPRAGLLLIGKHAAQFKEYLAKDHEYMYTTLLEWCLHNNRDNSKLALTALEAFLHQVSLFISETASKDDKGSAAIFKQFIQRFRTIIDNQQSRHKELSVAIKGYGYFAAPCKIFMKPEDLQFMFSEMVQRSEQLFFTTLDAMDERLFHLPLFLEALASIVKEIDEVSESFMTSLEKLMVLFFESLPVLPPGYRKQTFFAVLKLILGISPNRTALKTFLSHVVYQGLIRTCSHPPVLDVGNDELAIVSVESTDVLGNKRASYRDYVDLWRHLVDPTKLRDLNAEFPEVGMREAVQTIIYDEVIGSVLKIINRLNLSSKSPFTEDEPTSSESPTSPGPSARLGAAAEGNSPGSSPPPSLAVTSDPITGLQAAVPKDFHIFINLVDLCRVLLPLAPRNMFEPWVYAFGREMIVMSSSHPLVSGFYKMLGTCFKVCKLLSYFKGTNLENGKSESESMETDDSGSDKQACFILFQKFVREVLVRMKQYKDDLLASCLQLLLSLPKELVELEVEALVPALQMTFKLGLSYLPLANAGLDALEVWTSELSPKLLQPQFRHILPYLDDYLRTLSNAADSSSESGTVMVAAHSTRGRRKMAVKVIDKWKEGIEGAESPLNKIRRRIVHFLGALGGEINTSLVESESAAVYAAKAVACDARNRLEFAVPFQDMKPTLYLDPFLPRICELATSSSDRQTKIAACELLHALILFTIGKSTQPAVAKKSPMTKLYKKLFPIILQLACDVERVAEQLFRPLVFQMIHWFTRNTQYESPDTIALLDSILDGIVHPTDTALRDFCALCVREFLAWSIKQTTKKQQEKSPINTKSLLKRIYSLAKHPGASKRLGAALAINSIYSVFREEDALVDTFVLEMLVVMVESLRLAHRDDKSLGTREQACLSLDHLCRIVKVKSSKLITPTKTRRIPKGLKSADISNLVSWLLCQCGSPETDCRQQCRKMFIQFAVLIPKIATATVWIRRTLESEGGLYFVSRFEAGGQGHHTIQKSPTLKGAVFSRAEAIGWLESVTATLDCYNWVLKDQLFSPSELFDAQPRKSREKPTNLFQSLEFFLSNLALHGIEAAAKCFDSSLSTVHTPREIEEYNRVKCSCVLHLLNFTSILLDKHPNEAFSHVPSSLWNEQLFQLVAACCVRPKSIGFSPADVDTLEKLRQDVLSALKAYGSRLESNFKSNLVTILSTELSPGSLCDLIGQLPLSLHGDTLHIKHHNQLNDTISGLLLLQRSSLLLPALTEAGHSTGNLVPKVLESVFMTVKPLVSMTTGSTNDGGMLSPANKQSTQLLLELVLEIGISPSELVNCLLDISTGCRGLGPMLYQLFPGLLNGHILKEYEVFIAHLIGCANNNAETVSAILSGLLDYVARDRLLKRKLGVKVCNSLLSQWSQLGGWWGKKFDVDRRLAAVNILKKMFNIEPKLLLKTSTDPAHIDSVVSMYTTLIKETESSLAFKSKVFEVLHHFTSLPEEYLERIKSSINVLIAKQFPLKSTEFPAGSPQCNEYISVIEKLLSAMVVSHSVTLLQVLISVMCREKRHVHEEQIQSSLTSFVSELSTTVAKSAVGVAYEVFTNEQGYPPDARRAACERVCLTLLRLCSEQTVRDFFIDHVREIADVIEANLSKTAVESHLVSKLCCFQLVEVLYSRLSSGALNNVESKINTAYCKGLVKTGKELTQAVTKAGHAAKSEDLHGNKAHYELRRQYHCAAYNMVMSIISCTQQQLQFYTVFLFKEDPTKGQMLWDNIIDLDKHYHFETELETPLYRKKQMTAIRDKVRSQDSRESSPADSPPFPPRYLSSQYLADSSLSTDVSQFDFSSGTQVVPQIRMSRSPEPKETSSYVVTEEQIEQDELNQHECMLPLMRLLDHMELNKINPQVPKDATPDEMPQWMASMHKKFNNSKTHQNIRLFLARLITNRPKVFQPYARYWLPGLTQLIIGGNHGGAGIHYFIVDIVVTMLSWSTAAILDDRHLASRLLHHLMEQAHHDNRSVFRNNLEIIKTLVECWKESLQTPTRVIFSQFSQPGAETTKANRTGIQLLGVVAANGMAPYDPETAGSDLNEEKFYKTFVSLMSFKYKEVYAASAEVLGVVLAYMEEKKEYSLEMLEEEVVSRLTKLVVEREEDKFLTCLQKLQSYYPKLTERFAEKLLFLLPKFFGSFKSMCLEVLQPLADIRPNLYLELKDKGFHNKLSFRDEPTQTASLKIVQGMVQHQTLSLEQTTSLLPLVTAFGSHPSQPCRLIMYDTLIALYNNYSPTDEDSPTDEAKALLADVRDQLLQGLADDAEAIRLKMFAFWNEESRLASDTLGRLTQLLAVLYSTNTERQFLYHSTNLLLELTSRSPDFTRSMFDSPLSECKFEDYTGINLSWHQRHLQMTPLFAATQASTPGGTQMDQSLGSGLGTGALRATQQGLAFTPTQDMSGGDSSYNWMAPSLQSQDISFSIGSLDSPSQESTQSSLLFSTSKMKPPRRPLRPVGKGFGTTILKPDDLSSSQDPKEEQRREILKLKRRFIRDRKTTSEYYAKSQARKNIAREEVKKRQKAARDSQVVMYRKYRVGELPDIQIKHSELIRPFQALAQHDSTLARMLFSVLYKSVFVQVDSVLTDREAEATKKAIREGLNMVMENSEQFYPPFVGSLQDICFREKQLELEPTAVSRACLTCMQQPIGIMLLEKQLLNNRDSGLGPRPAKRARGASAPLPEGTMTWVELGRLYKSLGDFDTLCGIFSGEIGTKAVTRDALEAEERRDYQRALQLYKEAISCENWEGDSPLQVEEDFWDDSLLQCYNHLTEWQDLEKAALVNVEPPNLDSIWEESYYIEHYLPHVMHGKLKLACSGLDDHNFSRFLDKALQDAKQRAVLESEYSSELALYSILKNDLDRARYYSGLCLQSFLQEWSNIDKLLVKSRAARLQGLQSLTEMQEYLDLMAKTTNFESSHAVESLLNKWRTRFPHPKLDPINIWDDIITARCMMMRKILEHFHTLPSSTSAAPDSMEVDGEDGRVDLASLQRTFCREFTSLYLKMADTARLQCNYAVSKRYLQLTEAAIGEHFPSDNSLSLKWMHSVAEMRIQQAEQDPSPTVVEPLVALVDRLDGYNSQEILIHDHTLARNHYSLQGRAFDQLAKAFLDEEEGTLMMDVLKDSRLRELNKAIGLEPMSTPTREEISHKLLIRCMSSLKAGVKSGNAEQKATRDSEGMVKALVELASFCDEQLRLKEDEDIASPLDTSTFPSVVVTYTLKAMQYNSKSATQQLPRLLQLVELYPETVDKFKSKSAEVPNWMFIMWISQLVALLDKGEGPAIHDILISLAKDYPQALYYPFKISSCNFKFESTEEGRANKEAMAKLGSLLKSDLVDDFVRSLELLSSPELIFKDYCDNDLKPLMEASLPKRDPNKVKTICRQILEQLYDWESGSSSSLYAESGGSVSIEVGVRQKRFAKDFLKKVEEKFGKDGAKLHKMALKDFTSLYTSLFEQMRPGLNRTTGAALMKDYSPWLQSFQANQYSEMIEIPGQYDGKSKPLPEYHVKISGFDEKVLVMSSLRKPKRITIRGDDEREYMFLIKGGEDLRMDQRVEQVYETMNGILNEDSSCSQRELRLRTYQVIPMTPRVGLIEWMKNTKPLKDFLQDALTEDEKKHYFTASKWHNDWLGKYGRNQGEWYKTMYKKASRTEVEKEYRRKVTCVPWDLLRRAFMQLSSSPEAFLTLRSHFIQTTASMTMCQYVLGIGDRHLSNFMIDMECGGMIGIDFGHAFGTATQFLPFPELMPFRMTPQINNLVLPHTGSGQLKCCMVHTLRALRNSPRLLLNIMDVFVKEPSLDWKTLARKQIKSQRLSEETYSIEGVWYPKEKVRQAKNKLLGHNPSHVMLIELSRGHERSQEFPALRSILMGDKKYNKRAQVGKRCGNVEEQVDCLIDHATDPNILGRTYVGWEPWV